MAQLQTRPYTGPGDDTLRANAKVLPDHAKVIWVAAFNGAWDSWDASKTDLDQEGYAFATAWAAVNKLYKQVNGAWQKRDHVLAGDGHLSKVWRDAGGIARWKSTCSDDGVDLYGTRMTTDFQKDMCTRAGAGIAASGPLPVWLGIAHYRKFSQIGTVDRLYVDGRKLKAEGRWLTDAPDEMTRTLATAAFQKALDEANLLPAHRAIRTSIAFYPEAFEIEDCGIIAYTRGELEHIALTTRPGNSRVDFGLGNEEDTMKRSKNGRRELRREDAASIVGDELANQLYAADAALGEVRSDEQDGLIYRTVDDGDLEVSPDGGASWQAAVLVEERTMVPTHKPPLNDPGTAWDAAAARSHLWDAATDADGNFNAAQARKGFAVYDSQNPDNKTGMALPHHDIEGGTFITQQKGVLAAGGVTMGARGGIKEFQPGDNEAAQRHLAVHYGQMDRTPPWQQQKSDLRHRAEELWALEVLEDQDGLAAAQAQLRTDLEGGNVPKPTLADAVVMFQDAHDVGFALIRATGQAEFNAALATLVSDTQAVPAPAADDRSGRRVKGEMLTQLEGAVTSLADFLDWARENLPDEKPPEGTAGRTLVEPGVDFRAAYATRFHGEIAPDQSLMAAMTAEALMETAYHAGWTLMDIIAANVEAPPEELPLADRLANVQKALNEYGQILNQVLATAAEARSADGADDPAAGGAGVKPDGAAEGAVNPPPGEPDTTALGTVRGILDAIGELAERGDATADEAQNLIDLLPAALAGVVQPPSEDVAALIAEAQAPLLRQIEELRQLIEQGAPATRGDDGQPPAGPPPPRRHGLPSPRRGHQPSLLDEGAAQMTQPPRGMTIREFALRGARRGGFDPHQ